MNEIDKKLLNVDRVLCTNINTLDILSRDLVSQNLLNNLRTFVEHVALKIYSDTHPCKVDYDGIKAGIEYLKSNNKYLFLRRFHKFLQQTVSHYVPSEDGAERLMLKYYEYLLLTKNFLKEKYDLDVLSNLNKFPINMDLTMLEYYTKIAEKFNGLNIDPHMRKKQSRFYVQKSKAFFVDDKVYYENTLALANDSASKFDRFVAFSISEIPTNYAIKASLKDEEIEIANKKMPVKIITDWITSIRPCELNNFAKLFGRRVNIRSDSSEYIGIMNFLSKTGMSLVEVIDSTDENYNRMKNEMVYKAQSTKFISVLDECRSIVLGNNNGCNVLRYLLHTLTNKTIKLQYEYRENRYLSNLNLHYGSIPFDNMPFATSLKGHNPYIQDVFECIDAQGHEHELLAHMVNVNSSNKGQLYTNVQDVVVNGEIGPLIAEYNSRLYQSVKQQKRRIVQFGQNLLNIGCEEETAEIIRSLQALEESGIGGYKESVEDWLETQYYVDCDEKKKILKEMFQSTKVSFIYGPAGTGKSTLINHISNFFDDKTKLYMANTNPAVENLKRKVSASNCDFMTITKFLKSYNINTVYDVLIIDECSMVSNADMCHILSKANFEFLILVGDIYQIEAIDFGNWFSLARHFVSDTSINELTIPYRTKSEELLLLWKKVRDIEDDVTEHIVNYGYSSPLSESIFEMSAQDEIILCLNYDGLYGINNINRFLQNNNKNMPVNWGVWTYKVGDPVLFNESERFGSVLYNNLKGRIVNILASQEQITFSIEIDRVLNEFDIDGLDVELLTPMTKGKSVVQFSVMKQENDDDDEENAETIVPFQIAYAVSIHKAQGLEYDSVKVVITKDMDKMITHNIFYTAITRAKQKLKIYWTPESQQRIITNFQKNESKNDACILAARTTLKMKKSKKKKAKK